MYVVVVGSRWCHEFISSSPLSLCDTSELCYQEVLSLWNGDQMLSVLVQNRKSSFQDCATVSQILEGDILHLHLRRYDGFLPGCPVVGINCRIYCTTPSVRGRPHSSL
jgi:hypothetical protein